MQLNPKHFDVTLDAFLNSWNLNRIRTMTIEEYAELSDHDSLCYWLEYGTKDLGVIGRMSLGKFELWKPKQGEAKEFKDDRFKMEGIFAYKRQKGNTLEEAFSNIRTSIFEIVRHSLNQDWEAIERIEFHSIVKWKLACLFSNKKLLPVYSKRALLAIARGLGHTFTNKDSSLAIQNAIIMHKPSEEDMVDFSYRVYSQFAGRDKISNKSYFIVGGKYSDDSGNDTVSVIEKFIENRCIAIGWLDWLDFSNYFGKSPKVINEFVDNNWDDESPSLGKIKSYFRNLGQMKQGDIIAVKSQGAYGQLKIIAYAEVVEREGRIYWHDDDLLGHHINVEFIEAGFVHETGETYAGTIHKLAPEKDGEKFYKIFGWYSGNQYNDVFDEEEESEFDAVNVEPTNEGYNNKIETSFERSAIASVIVNRLHNRIQNRFIQYLKKTYPDHLCSGEKRFIDAKRISPEEIIIYEIKPFASAYSCIRQGIGQLFDYLHHEKSNKPKRIIIVGPNEPTSADLKFLHEIREMLKVPFGYIAFDEANVSVKEY
ncbi:hypothetical protein [Chryseobacterium sp. G0201]|uniref:hypothetical protein n=1 Tax=Chryseobacterium sp. G0201 TaxID=2487065 RepID=UPI000F502C66|nr:hypothetical protein [Chryseobacterium sp. G0201]AZA54589.1 hypothetical protein EG348_17105 [Chryseobacterium sp. G0201]